MTRRLSFNGCRLGMFTDQFGRQVSLTLRNSRVEGDLELRRLASLREDSLLVCVGRGCAGSR